MKQELAFPLGLAGLALAALPTSAQTHLIAWGDNRYGQCDVPSLPAGLDYVEIDAGPDFSLALRSDGSVVAWGDNNNGECDVPAPPPGTSYVDVEAGWVVAAALLSDGSAAVWGWNHYGQCDVPALPPGLTYVQISASLHCLGLRSDGSVVAWGSNSSGQCNVPALPAGLSYVQVEASWSHSAALRSDGSVVAWGFNGQGQCNVPPLPPGRTYVQISGGGGQTVARRDNGSVVQWGAAPGSIPALPPGLTYVDIAAGSFHCLGRRSDGSLVAWGRNDDGQCDVPVLPWGPHWGKIAAGGRHSLALCSGSAPPPQVYCTAKVNSLGCLPAIGFSGTLARSGPDDFVIGASDVRSFRSGLLFWGRAPLAVPFQGGLRCVAMPIARTPLQDSGGTPGVDDCSGTFAFAMTNAYLSEKGLGIGDDLYAQYWSRDAQSAPYLTSLTDALHAWIDL